MARLLDRNRQIPNGFKFALPEVNYVSRPFDSFNTICTAVLSIVRANPERSRSHNWPSRQEDVEDWVDDFNARLCQSAGWNEYITTPVQEVAPPPKYGSRPGKSAAVAAGAKSIVEWIAGGSRVVDPEQATHRAKTCVSCSFNKPGDLTNFFDRATSEMIKKYIQSKSDIKLTTRFDLELGVCDACYCPLKLKVWSPLEHILNHMAPYVEDELAPQCWIRAERTAHETGTGPL